MIVIMLSESETLIALVANSIAVYSLLKERDDIPGNVTLYGFVLDSIPSKYKEHLTTDIIEDVFESVTAAHNS